ncbi:aminotransferase [Marinicauda salina]|uniref:Aminotransferase n=2 Tax=Marinicauda salina TaxID=2135793 RepID=A0A2U2BR44_9PROT|nr:aminotransferase [Marinicauda salina]
MGPLPRAAVEAGRRAYERKAAPWGLSIPDDFFGVPEALRGEAAKLFASDADSVALVPSASYGLAAAAANIRLEAGSEILLLDGQFPSNVYVWRTLAERDGAIVKTVARSGNETWTEALAAAIGDRTGLVACPAVHWIDGGNIDLAALRPALREAGAALVLDLTQSLGAQPFDVGAVDPDFAVAAAYKWLCGPYNSAFLYVAERHHDGTPLEENWIAREGSSDFARLIDYRDAYEAGARRFDMGERSAFQIAPATLESLRLVNAIGPAAIAARCAELTAAIEAAAAPLGLAADTPDRAAHYLALALPEGAPSDLLERLKAEGVHLSQRGPRLRIAPHFYNDEADIARFAAALGRALA